ncbi:VrrA/YqfQ family protein [Bacillus sp. 1P06AnD]|uniref:VrrA/YqfQ family protein n=1 Tax=Bacillus sp. 1P06AnD TaxID=3132208 RepID=UPI0039A1B8DA
MDSRMDFQFRNSFPPSFPQQPPMVQQRGPFMQNGPRQPGPQQPFSRRSNQMNPFMGQRQMPPMNMPQQPFNGQMQPQMNGKGEKKGGLLSKLLRKSDQKQTAAPAPSMFSLPGNNNRSAASAVQGAAASSSGGILQSIMNPGNLTTMLNNTQRVLQAADSFAPLVQQYGPLVKNIPAMWKLYRGLKDTDTTADATESPVTAVANQHTGNAESGDFLPDIRMQREEISIAADKTNKDRSTISPTAHIKPRIKAAKERRIGPAQVRRPGESLPKLFIPKE